MIHPTAIDPLDVMVLAGQGKTARETADELGCDRSWVYKIAKECGITFAAKGQHPNRTPDDVRARVLELRNQGWTLAQIADDVGRSRSWVAMHLRGER